MTTPAPRRRRILRNVRFTEFSAVDVPAHEGALAAIQKRAPILKTETMKEPPTMSDLATLTAELTKAKDQIAALSGQVTTITTERDRAAQSVASLTRALAMPPSHVAHCATLPEGERVAFVAKSAAQRDADVAAAEALDPVVVEYGGIKVRKSHGDLAIKFAQDSTAMAKALEEARDRDHRVQLEKRASTELGNLGGDLAARVLLLKAVGTLSADDQAKVKPVLASANEAAGPAFKRRGHSDSADDGEISTLSDVDARIGKIAKKLSVDRKIPYEQAYVITMDANHPDHSDEAIRLYNDHYHGNR